MTATLSRREALAGAASMALAGLSAGSASAARQSIPALESAAVVGRAALAAGVRPFTATEAAACMEDLPERNRRDFADGHTEIVGGWMLGRTEARFFAHIAQSVGA